MQSRMRRLVIAVSAAVVAISFWALPAPATMGCTTCVTLCPRSSADAEDACTSACGFHDEWQCLGQTNECGGYETILCFTEPE